MQAGLPVLAAINSGNDLETLIRSEGVGRVCADGTSATLQRCAEDLLDDLSTDAALRQRCMSLCAEMFAPDVAARKIVDALTR
jgi:hypothetical protein